MKQKVAISLNVKTLLYIYRYNKIHFILTTAVSQLVEPSPHMRDFEVRSPVAIDLSCYTGSDSSTANGKV